jgi:RsiW-degrading membrane proteinase PrsW (M82 family)
MDTFETKLKETLQNNINKNVSEIPIPMRDVLISSFRGEMKKFSLIVWILMLVFGGLTVACGTGFFYSDDPKTQLLFIVMANLFILLIGFVKLWYWMLANRNATNREIKRLEMRIVELTEKLSNR